VRLIQELNLVSIEHLNNLNLKYYEESFSYGGTLLSNDVTTMVNSSNISISDRLVESKKHHICFKGGLHKVKVFREMVKNSTKEDSPE
jgi:hypothetical protein